MVTMAEQEVHRQYYAAAITGITNCLNLNIKAFLSLVCLLSLITCVVVNYKRTSFKTYSSESLARKIIRERYSLRQHSESYFSRVLWESQVRLAQFNQSIYNDDGHVILGPPIASKIDSGQGKKVKMILLWTSFYGNAEWGPKIICEGQEKMCITTSDKDNLLKSDALIMHPIDMEILPRQRLPSQRYIYFIQEPPHLVGMTGFNIKNHNSVFNWTMTYRHESDFPVPLCQSEPLKSPLTFPQYNSTFTKIIQNKRRLVFAAISNCDRKHTERLSVIKELQKYVQVDFYGKCGQKTCRKDSEKCTKIFSEYKFFLAFENSYCRDYITEKAGRALHVFNAIPIVMGGSHSNDYLKIMPPQSYIHSQGFATVKDLADFMIFLDEKDLFYERFHLWHKTHGEKRDDSWCNLCKGLHDPSLPSKVYNHFDQWYLQDTCSGYSQIKNQLILPLGILYNLYKGMSLF